MRIRINLKTNGKEITANYKHFIQAFIYNALKSNDRFNDLHNIGYKLDNRPFKLFVISDIIGSFEYTNDNKNLLFKTDSYFELASIDEDLIVYVVNYLSLNNFIHIGNTVIEHNGYKIISTNISLDKDEYTFHSISPVTCYRIIDKKTHYYSPSDQEFCDLILGNIQKKASILYPNITISPQITEIKELRKRLVHFKNTFIIAFDIELKFKKMSKELFDLIFLTGVGSKNSLGFGMMKY